MTTSISRPASGTDSTFTTRMRALANFIDTHHLPCDSITVATGKYRRLQLNVGDLTQLLHWAPVGAFIDLKAITHVTSQGLHLVSLDIKVTLTDGTTPILGVLTSATIPAAPDRTPAGGHPITLDDVRDAIEDHEAATN